MRGLLTPLWFVLCTMNLGKRGIHSFSREFFPNKFIHSLKNDGFMKNGGNSYTRLCARKQKSLSDDVDTNDNAKSSRRKIKSFSPKTANQIV